MKSCYQILRSNIRLLDWLQDRWVVRDRQSCPGSWDRLKGFTSNINPPWMTNWIIRIFVFVLGVFSILVCMGSIKTTDQQTPPLKLLKDVVYVFKFSILRRIRLLDVSGLIQMSIKWFEKVDKKSKIRKSTKLISQQSVLEVKFELIQSSGE